MSGHSRCPTSYLQVYSSLLFRRRGHNAAVRNECHFPLLAKQSSSARRVRAVSGCLRPNTFSWIFSARSSNGSASSCLPCSQRDHNAKDEQQPHSPERFLLISVHESHHGEVDHRDDYGQRERVSSACRYLKQDH